MINHSCQPNADFHFSGQESSIVVRALRDIAAGEEVCISYCGLEPLVNDKVNRQKELRSWFDVCACVVCSRPDSASTQPKMLTLLTPLLRVAATHY
jgi:SET domain-containing protein